MEGGNPDWRVLGLFAGMLDYPGEALAPLAEEAEKVLSENRPEASSLLAEFRASLRDTSPARMEEIYTATFDLQAACCPYIGVHLFGEGHKRRIFLARLNDMYGDYRFRAAGELPDHLASVLRFLADSAWGDDARALREDGLLPALEKMAEAFPEGSANPYGKLLGALRIALRPGMPVKETPPVPGREV
ncbi:MAG: molecular chaperone TorD family protein [Deltaproteobacteria bacterium]|nr:molecular chaperone TorD family protein [Deltaproteobacteria bacterium]